MKFKTEKILPVTKEKYLELVENFKDEFNSLSYVISIGQFGEIKCPGVSDIDLILVVKNNYLPEVLNRFNKWTGTKIYSNYCFYHPPLFINENLIKSAPYLHSLDNIKWLAQKEKVEFPQNPDKAVLFLMWTLYLLPIIAKIVFEKIQISIRESLLILKNLHNSHYYLSILLEKDSAMPSRSDDLRKRILNEYNAKDKINNTILNSINCEYKNTLSELLELIDLYSVKFLNNTKEVIFRKNFHLSDYMVIRKATKSKIILKKGKIIFELNINLINLFFQIRNWQKNINFLNYVKHLEYAYRECKNEGIPMQFITPLSFPVFKNSKLSFRLKKHYQLIRKHKLLY